MGVNMLGFVLLSQERRKTVQSNLNNARVAAHQCVCPANVLPCLHQFQQDVLKAPHLGCSIARVGHQMHPLQLYYKKERSTPLRRGLRKPLPGPRRARRQLPYGSPPSSGRYLFAQGFAQTAQSATVNIAERSYRPCSSFPLVNPLPRDSNPGCCPPSRSTREALVSALGQLYYTRCTRCTQACRLTSPACRASQACLT